MRSQRRSMCGALAALALAACATSDDPGFEVGREETGFAIIGVAEAARATEPAYSMLWRRLDPTGAFEPFDDRTSFEARSNANRTVRVDGIPGEFTLVELPAGAYALDSVFAEINIDRVSYFANGVIRGPERPAFALHPGEAVYVGIWQAHVDDVSAEGSLWRLEAGDLRAVLAASQARIVGDVVPRQTYTANAACAPRRLNSMTQRQIC